MRRRKGGGGGFDDDIPITEIQSVFCCPCGKPRFLLRSPQPPPPPPQQYQARSTSNCVFALTPVSKPSPNPTTMPFRLNNPSSIGPRVPQAMSTATPVPLRRRLRLWFERIIPNNRTCKFTALFVLLLTELITGLAIAALSASNTADGPIVPRCRDLANDPEGWNRALLNSQATGDPACWRVGRNVRSALMVGYLVLFITNIGLICWVYSMKVDERNWGQRPWRTRRGFSGWSRIIGARRSIS